MSGATVEEPAQPPARSIPVATNRHTKLRRGDVRKEADDDTEEVRAVRKAIDGYKRKYRRPNPDCAEVFYVFWAMGYRRVAPPVAA